MSALHAHLVVVTRFRHTFADPHPAPMKQIMRAVCADFEAKVVEFNAENNHLHLLVNFPPKVAIAKPVNSLQGHVQPPPAAGPDPRRHYHRTNKLWSGSYLPGSLGGAPLNAVRQYIEQQNPPVQGTLRPDGPPGPSPPP